MEPPVEGLLLSGNHACVDEVHHAGGEHLGVNTQILLICQEGAHGVGNAADTQLNGVTVVDQRSNCFADFLLGFGGFHVGDDILGTVHLHQHVHVPDVDGGGSVHMLEVRVYLQNDPLVLLHGGQHTKAIGSMVHGNMEISVFIHGSDCGNGNIGGMPGYGYGIVALEIGGNILHQSHGQRVLIEGGAKEVVVHFNVAAHSWVYHKGIQTTAALPDLYVFHIGGDLVEVGENLPGLRIVVGGENHIAGVDGGEDLRDGVLLFLI